MFMKYLHAIQVKDCLFKLTKKIVFFNSNLYQLLLLQAKDCPEMVSWLHQKGCIFPEIVNEIISAMGQCVLCNILVDVSIALQYSIIVDEATDISYNKQMSLSVRWVGTNYKIHEYAFGLIQLPNTKAETIFLVIRDILI